MDDPALSDCAQLWERLATTAHPSFARILSHAQDIRLWVSQAEQLSELERVKLLEHRATLEERASQLTTLTEPAAGLHQAQQKNLTRRSGLYEVSLLYHRWGGLPIRRSTYFYASTNTYVDLRIGKQSKPDEHPNSETLILRQVVKHRDLVMARCFGTAPIRLRNGPAC